jgi:ABC-type Fe3+/spermidine/putrescine transport system ATPase subunit
MALLELQGLHKRFESPAVAGVDLSMGRGEILCLLGPSGCGKTTLLRLVAGLETPDAGRVIFDGKDVTDVKPHCRNFGLMFQEFALFPHKNVFENVAFGPRMQNDSPETVRGRTNEMLELVGLTDLALRNVADLSGGERQRVALARSLAPRPRLLMLDEPMGALDRALRERLLEEIRVILKTLAMPAIFVTHDQSEAMAMADRIAVMNDGRLEQVDRPEALYDRPRSLFVARFVGFQNFLPGRITGDGGVETRLGRFFPARSTGGKGAAVTLVLRPEGARIYRDGTVNERNPLIEGVLVARRFAGAGYRVKVAVDDRVQFVFTVPANPRPPAEGETIRMQTRSSQLVVIAQEDKSAVGR